MQTKKQQNALLKKNKESEMREKSDKILMHVAEELNSANKPTKKAETADMKAETCIVVEKVTSVPKKCGEDLDKMAMAEDEDEFQTLKEKVEKKPNNTGSMESKEENEPSDNDGPPLKRQRAGEKESGMNQQQQQRAAGSMPVRAGDKHADRFVKVTFKLPPLPQKIGFMLHDDEDNFGIPILMALSPESPFHNTIPSNLLDKNHWIIAIKDQRMGGSKILNSNVFERELMARRKERKEGEETFLEITFFQRGAPPPAIANTAAAAAAQMARVQTSTTNKYPPSAQPTAAAAAVLSPNQPAAAMIQQASVQKEHELKVMQHAAQEQIQQQQQLMMQQQQMQNPHLNMASHQYQQMQQKLMMQQIALLQQGGGAVAHHSTAVPPNDDKRTEEMTQVDARSLVQVTREVAKSTQQNTLLLYAMQNEYHGLSEQIRMMNERFDIMSGENKRLRDVVLRLCAANTANPSEFNPSDFDDPPPPPPKRRKLVMPWDIIKTEVEGMKEVDLKFIYWHFNQGDASYTVWKDSLKGGEAKKDTNIKSASALRSFSAKMIKLSGLSLGPKPQQGLDDLMAWEDQVRFIAQRAMTAATEKGIKLTYSAIRSSTL